MAGRPYRVGGFGEDAAVGNWSLMLMQGLIAGHTGLVVRGHNPSISVASSETDMNHWGDMAYMATAETMNIISDSTEDHITGPGLQTCLVDGIANGGSEITEVVAMNGTDGTPTVNEYKRVNTMIGLTVGSSGYNIGDVCACAAIASSTQSQIGPKEGISHDAAYTIPIEKDGYVVRAEYNAGKAGGGQSPEVEFKGIARNSTANPWIQVFDKKLDEALADEIDIDITQAPGLAVGGADIRMTAITDQDATEVRSRMTIILVDKQIKE